MSPFAIPSIVRAPTVACPAREGEVALADLRNGEAELGEPMYARGVIDPSSLVDRDRRPCHHVTMRGQHDPMTGPVLPPGVPPNSDPMEDRSRAETVLRVVGIVIGVFFVVGLFYFAYIR